MSNRKPLDVVDGLRGPEADVPRPEQYRPQPPELPVPISDLPPGTVEYHSMSTALWLHLADSHKLRDPDTGFEITRPGFGARFNGGIYRTADPEIIHRLEGCAFGCELHPHGFPAHSGYGLGRVFWRLDVARKAAQEKQEQSDVERFKSDPAAAQRLIQQLQAAGALESAGFTLPARQPKTE